MSETPFLQAVIIITKLSISVNSYKMYWNLLIGPKKVSHTFLTCLEQEKKLCFEWHPDSILTTHQHRTRPQIFLGRKKTLDLMGALPPSTAPPRGQKRILKIFQQ